MTSVTIMAFGGWTGKQLAITHHPWSSIAVVCFCVAIGAMILMSRKGNATND